MYKRNLDLIRNFIIEYFGVGIINNSRKIELVYQRKFVISVLIKEFKINTSDIGSILQKHRTTIIYHRDEEIIDCKYEEFINHNKDFIKKLKQFLNITNNGKQKSIIIIRRNDTVLPQTSSKRRLARKRKGNRNNAMSDSL